MSQCVPRGGLVPHTDSKGIQNWRDGISRKGYRRIGPEMGVRRTVGCTDKVDRNIYCNV
jgi:hypothetical protein